MWGNTEFGCIEEALHDDIHTAFNNFFSLFTIIPASFTFFLIFSEMAIYLTYFKDIFYALGAMINFIGALLIARSLDVAAYKKES